MNSTPIKINVTGDLVLNGAAGNIKGNSYPVIPDEAVVKLFNLGDLNIVNLESPLTVSEKKIIKTGPCIKSDPASVSLLKNLKINLACLSNNHIRDYGDEGVIETIRTCRKEGIEIVGADLNIEEAGIPYITEIRGIKTGVLNFSESEFNAATADNAGSNPADPINIWYAVNKVRRDVDYLIVIIHGGKEHYPYPTPEFRRLCQYTIDIGADIVVGHHPHVTCGYEFYSGKPVIYSLGNFIFDEPGNTPEWYKGAVMHLELNTDLIPKIKFYEVAVKNGSAGITKVQDISTESPDLVMEEMNEPAVKENWAGLISSKHKKTNEYLLRRGYLLKLLSRLGIKFRYTRKERKFLLSLRNRLTSNTFREFSKACIDKIIDE
jgi:poly-gamma-glutamate synthesis protein (capsule biosynthesis protein)